MAHPSVIEALRLRKLTALKRLKVTEDLVLAELAAIAFSNLDDFVTWDEKAGSLVVRPSAEIPRHLLAALESVEDQTLTSTNRDGSRSYERHKQRVKLYPKIEALKLLAEYLGLTDTLAPKVIIYLKTGIVRRQPAALTVEPEEQPAALPPAPDSSPPGAPSH